MGKLHELLAVEPDLKGQAQRALSQAISLFTDGKQRLIGQFRTYQPLEEGGESFPDEVTVLSTSVDAELEEAWRSFGAWLDASIQKEHTNRETGADIMIGDRVIFENLPAPALLNLESKLGELRALYKSIPTTDPSENWTWDEMAGSLVSDRRMTYRTQKVMKSFVAHEATPEHPAQVEVYHEDIRVGSWTTTIYSGMISPSRKRELLRRLNELIRAVKQARQRANDIDASRINVWRNLFGYIHEIE